MKKQLRGYEISLAEVLDAHTADSANQQFIVPVKATVMAFKAGTLVQDHGNRYFVVTMGEWHREGDNTLPQVDAFDQLNAVGLTVLKEDKMKEIFEKFAAKEPKEASGQEDGKHNSTNDAQADSPVEANSKRQKKSKDRTGAV